MGRAIVRRLVEGEYEVVGAAAEPGSTDIGEDVGLLSGVSQLNVNVQGSDSLESLIEETSPDVAVDFTQADACVSNMSVILANKVNAVIGTTGFSDEQAGQLHSLIDSNGVGAVISPNMSIGINVFWQLVADAARKLPGYDIEIAEAHHRLKKDAPSGTALKTAEVVCDALGKALEETLVYGRKGEQPRADGEIGMQVIRAGDIVGDHTVLFGASGERLEITHRAHSRDAFVSGVLKAVEFVNGRKGVYSMGDVLGL